MKWVDNTSRATLTGALAFWQEKHPQEQIRIGLPSASANASAEQLGDMGVVGLYRVAAGERFGDWLQTYSGRKFYPLDPRPEDVVIEDIAHALANTCRYAGHSLTFYCPTEEARVLTADLQWRHAGDLTVGTELFGFDEHPTALGSCGKKRRRFRPSVITTATRVKRRIYRLEMEDGSTVRSSVEHPWLIATKASRNQTWVQTGEIAKAIAEGRARYMHRFFDVWDSDSSRRTGWLAGIFDGEGHLSFQSRRGVQMGLSQRPGAVLDEAMAAISALGFAYAAEPAGCRDVIGVRLRGGWRDAFHLLGRVRPIRLLDKVVTGLRTRAFDKQMDGKDEPLRIVHAWEEGEEWVAGLETSSRTYLCEGFGAHNSVAEHAVQVSLHVPPQHALWGLLHDAAEAYTADIPRPLKPFLFGWKEIEARVMRAVCDHFGLPHAEPPEVKAVDTGILADEKFAVMEDGPAWGSIGAPIGAEIRGLSPMEAKIAFLARFHALTRGGAVPA